MGSPKRFGAGVIVVVSFDSSAGCCGVTFFADGECGLSSYDDAGDMELPPPGQRIVGGEEPRLHEFPWLVRTSI